MTIYAGEDVEWGKHSSWNGMEEWKHVQPLWKSVWRVLKTLGINLPQDPAIPFLGIYPKDAQSYHKDMCSSMSIAALFIITGMWKQPRCSSTKEWIKKMWYICTVEYYSVVKIQWRHEICRQMNGTRKKISWVRKPRPREPNMVCITHKWILDAKQSITSL